MRERKHLKLYWADPGLPRAMKKQFGAPVPEERGHLFEGWVASVLRAHRDYAGLFDEWAHWAPGKGSDVEMDFVLQRGSDIVGIEAKSTRDVADKDLRGLRALVDLPRVRRRLVVRRTERASRTTDVIDIPPVERFLEELQAGKLFP